MATMTLLSLPTEILDQIYSYLDWDRSKSLRPHRPDIFSISLTCRHLRRTIVPLIFQDVILKLRWVDGVLVEPALFEVRKNHPHLGKFPVHSPFLRNSGDYDGAFNIKTNFRRPPDPYGRLKDFVVPDDLSDWVRPLVKEPNQDIEAQHRDRVHALMKTLMETYNNSDFRKHFPQHLNEYVLEVARRLLDSDEYLIAEAMQNHLPSNSNSAIEIPRLPRPAAPFDSRHRLVDALDGATAAKDRRKFYRSRRQELDALVLVVLCLPASVNSLAFESVHNHFPDSLKNNFALHVAAMALGIFGDRLKRLTMITSPERDFGDQTNELEHQRAENIIITEQVLNRITRVSELILSDYHGDGNPRHRELSSDWQVRWHILADIVTHLEIWNVACNPSELVQLVSGFTCLQSLALQEILLKPPARQRTQTDQLIWLNFLIELRRQVPDLKLRLGELKSWSDRLVMVVLPRSALAWLQKEAVPAGCTIGFDRETRLNEDFVSFLPLWFAEDSQRGQQAREDPKIGRLIDHAMDNRWREVEHSR